MDTMILAIRIYVSLIVLIYVLVGLFTNCFQDKISAWKEARDTFYEIPIPE